MAKPLLYTKEELIGILLSKQEKLGRKPKKSDMSDVIRAASSDAVLLCLVL